LEVLVFLPFGTFFIAFSNDEISLVLIFFVTPLKS